MVLRGYIWRLIGSSLGFASELYVLFSYPLRFVGSFKVFVLCLFGSYVCLCPSPIGLCRFLLQGSLCSVIIPLWFRCFWLFWS